MKVDVRDERVCCRQGDWCGGTGIKSEIDG
jgi:hypothetical protein